MAINVIESTGSAGEVSQADPVKSFSFADVHEKAMAYGEENTPATPEHVDPSPAPSPVAEVKETPQATPTPEGEVTKVDTASEKKLATLGDDDLVEIEVDGAKQTLPWKEARGYTMRQAKFTKEMQALATQRKEVESQQATLAQLREEHGALVTLLKDEQLLGKFLAQRYPQLLKAQTQIEQAAEAVDPGDIATVQQIQEARQEFAKTITGLVEAIQQDATAREAAVVQRIRDAQEVQRLQGEIRTTMDSLFEAHPYIKKVIPNAEDNLRYEVAKLHPDTPEKMVEAIKTVFGGWVDEYKTAVAETSKRSVIEKHKLETNNIQSPGGSHVQPQPQSYMKQNRAGKTELDWKALHNTAMDMLNKK